MKKNKWIWIGAAVIIVLIVAAIYSSRGKKTGEVVQVESPEMRTLIESVVASGKIFPEIEVKISSDVSGEIVELLVQEGDSVVMGQLLAKIDPDIYLSNVERGVAALNTSKSQLAQSQAQVQNAIAQKEQIEAQLVNARAIHERNIKLRKDNVISTAEFEVSESNMMALEANLKASIASVKAAEKNVDAARYSVSSSEASLKELRTSLQRTSIFSPVNGIVSKLDVEKGERVVGTMQMAGTEMMRISNMNTMEVQVEVSENDILRVSLGDEVEVEVDAYIDRKFNGKVTQIANTANLAVSPTGVQQLSSDQVSNFIVRIRLDPESYSDLSGQKGKYPFRPGMSASVSIATSKVTDALSVPIQAVTTRDINKKKTSSRERQKELTDEEDSEDPEAIATAGRTGEDLREVVFVVEADTVRMVQVVTGIQDDSFIEIKDGLTKDMKVVSGPYSAVARRLEQGSKVKVE